MVFFTVAGKVVGYTVKGVGTVANALFREATGIDVKKTVSDVATTNEKIKKINNDDSLTSEQKHAYSQSAFNNMQNDIKKQVKDKNDENRKIGLDYAADKIESMSDGEINQMLNNPNVNAKTKSALDLEKEKRNNS